MLIFLKMILLAFRLKIVELPIISKFIITLLNRIFSKFLITTYTELAYPIMSTPKSKNYCKLKMMVLF